MCRKSGKGCPAPSPGPAPSTPSLLVLAEHVVLFALHVFKVKVAPGHALVDVLDVVASGLKVGGGVVGGGGEDLGDDRREEETEEEL